MPKAAEPARPVIKDLPASLALSIVKNGPKTFKGRKLGVLVTDGVDAALLAALAKAAKDEGALIELVAPKVGGVTDSTGKLHPAQQKINGGPSVLYDAVAILASADGAKPGTSSPTPSPTPSSSPMPRPRSRCSTERGSCPTTGSSRSRPPRMRPPSSRNAASCGCGGARRRCIPCKRRPRGGGV
jgi:hypothetical protein